MSHSLTLHDILSTFIDPVTKQPIKYSDVKAVDDKISVIITVQNAKYIALYEALLPEINNALSVLPHNINVILTNSEQPSKWRLPAKHIIMVASGKGGVGKSTVAANIAATLALQNQQVALVDLDIHGPSIPSLFNINKKPTLHNGKALPHKKYNIHLMSVGFFVEEGQALIWRGPMASKMLYQLLQMTAWPSDLDYMVIDTPPGTSDVHLSLLENYAVDRAIIVATPQQLAASDVQKGIEMLHKFNIPIAGIVENMSYIITENKDKIHIFGHSQTPNIAKKAGVPILLELPLLPEFNDSHGKPATITHHKLYELFANIKW